MKLISRDLEICLLCMFVAGCGGGNDNSPAQSHGHVHSAPHSGILVELGDHSFNLEFLLDARLGFLSVYILGPHAEKFIRIEEESLYVNLTSAAGTHDLRLGAMANELTNERVGDTSHFSGSLDWLKGKNLISGVMRSVEIQGEVYEEVSFDLGGDREHDH
jgi:hypothetical protein